MVDEGWSLNDVIAFAKEYKIKLTVTDKVNTVIPEDKYKDFSSSAIIEQSRPVGDAIIEGITFKVKINATFEEQKNDENNDTELD